MAVSASSALVPPWPAWSPGLAYLPSARMGVRVMSWDERDLDNLIEEITVDSYGDDEQMSSFECAFDELGTLPDATVIGEPVAVHHVSYDGDERRGLSARCRRNGHDYSIALLELTFPSESDAARLVAAYRRWLGVDR